MALRACRHFTITWLKDAGLIYKIHRVTKIEHPLSFYEDFDVFKIFPLDVGLLGAMTDVPASQMLLGDNIFKEFKGAFTECYVNEQLARIQIPTFYYSTKTYINTHSHLKGLRVSMKNYIDQDWMENLPLFAIEGYLRAEGIPISNYSA